MSKIKRSVSLYSYQDEYATKRMSLEDLMAELHALGCQGVELISDQMIHGSPFPAQETIDLWKGYLEKYRLEPVCNDIFINSTLYRNRRLTLREEVRLLKDELINAHNLGFHQVRLVSNTDAALLEPCLETAQKYDVVMALEIHAGMSFLHPGTKAFIEVMKRLHSPYVGLVIDMGIMCRRHPRVASEYMRQFGLTDGIIQHVDDIFTEGSDPLHYYGIEASIKKEIPRTVQNLIKTPIDRDFWLFASGYENTPLSALDEYLPYTKSFHGKIYEMTDEGVEYSIPYEQIIRHLDEAGWGGYISTEYEGNRFVLIDHEVDSVKHVRRHQALMKRIIGQ